MRQLGWGVAALAMVFAGCGDDEGKLDMLSTADMATSGGAMDMATTGGQDAGATGGDMSMSNAKTVTVMVGAGSGFSFSPQTVTINFGDTVQWVWMNGPHTVTSGTPHNPDGKFCSIPSGTTASPTTCANLGIAAHEGGFTYSHTFNSARGNFPYYCVVHQDMGMTGTVIVQ